MDDFKVGSLGDTQILEWLTARARNHHGRRERHICLTMLIVPRQPRHDLLRTVMCLYNM